MYKKIKKIMNSLLGMFPNYDTFRITEIYLVAVYHLPLDKGIFCKNEHLIICIISVLSVFMIERS